MMPNNKKGDWKLASHDGIEMHKSVKEWGEGVEKLAAKCC